MRRLTATCVLLFALPLAALAAGDPFPKPAELAPDVDFWRSIFSEYATDEGVLHDNRNLAVVYERLDMPSSLRRSERNRRIAARRRHYQDILRKLASGKRDNLNAEEQRVLDLWGAEVSDDELTAAVGRIRFQQGLSNRFAEGLRRAGRWREYVIREFTELGVPVELAALPHVESSYDPDARSHVGASGIWQFTRSTGRRYMRVDHVVDERNDPFLATTAAGKLLAYNYSIAGNWPMAITAYNHGLAGVRRAMRRYGDEAYADILRNYKSRTFGFASRNFYVAFLAALEIDRDPERYFPGLVPEQPVDYEIFYVDAYVPAAALSDVLGVSERELARHNPALQATIWEGSKHVPREFELRLPRARLNGSPPELLAAIAPDLRYDEQLPDLFHTVARGDTLSRIATEYGTSVSTLVALNGLRSRHRIRAGQQIRLPAAGPLPEAVTASAAAPEPVPQAPPVEVLANVPAAAAGPIVAEEAGAEPEGLLGEALVDSAADSLQAALLSDPSDYTVAEDLTIEVQPLETLGHYADWLGIRTQRLRDINGLAFRTPVVVGQRIRLEFGSVSTDAFEEARSTYHREQQDAFFRDNRITGVREHVIRDGESVWILALRRYDVPIWLFRQYNPEIDLGRVAAGMTVRFPVLSSSSG